MKFHLLLILLLPATLQNCQSQHTKNSLLPEPIASLPIKLIDNRPMIEVEVNGIKGHFIVDTGGTFGLNEDFADSSKVEKGRSFQIQGAGNNPQTAWHGKNTEVKLVASDLTLSPHQAVIVNLNPIKDSLQLPYADGVIGVELFRSYVVGINYPDRKINLYNKNNFPELPSGFQSIPISFHHNYMPKVEAKVNGLAADLVIDTGDRSKFTLFNFYAQENRFLERSDLSELRTTGYGLGGPIPAKEFYLEEISLGRNEVISFKHIKTRIPFMEGGAFTNTQRSGSIGSGLFLSYEIIFNYGGKQMLIREAPSLQIPQFTYISSQLQETTQWYQDVLGFEVSRTNSDTVVLSRGKAKICFVAKPMLPTKNDYKADHKVEPNGVFKFGFSTPHVKAYHKAIEEKMGLDLRFMQFYTNYFFLLRDPEGNMLQFFENITGEEEWQNRFYAFITNSESEYKEWVNKVKELEMVELFSFNKPEEGTYQQNYSKGNIAIELICVPDRSHAANKLAASGIQTNDAWHSIITE